MFSIADHEYMNRAIQLAKRGLYSTDPNPRVGCVIVKEGTVIGEGWHEVAGQAHAEVNALAQAGAQANGATVYVTLEPCCHQGKTPPCTDALVKAKVARVVAAMQDPNPQVAGNGLQQLMNKGIEVDVGLLESEAAELNIGFVKRMRQGRPYVRNKLAMSLDGRTAMASGESKWITQSAARQDVQHWRARSSAVLTGAGTILADDPAMTVRLDAVVRQPKRFIIDTNLSTPVNAKILSQPGETHILTCVDEPVIVEQLSAKGAQVHQLPKHNGRVELGAVMDYLARQEVNEVLLETGATLSGAMLSAGFIDELIIYVAPLLMGDSARGLFKLPQLQAMADRMALTIEDIRLFGQDIRIIARPNP